MMTELTAEQEQTLKKYSENMNSIPTLTHKMNRKVITRELKIFFDFLGKSFPKHVVITRSPIEAQLVANYLNMENFNICIATHSPSNNHRWVKDAVRKAKIMKEKIPDQFKLFHEYEYLSKGMLNLFNYFRIINLCDFGEGNNLIKCATTIRKYTHWVYMFEEVVIVSMNPIRVEKEDNKIVMQEYADGFIVDTRK